jgi:outer membrane protein OmpA-like peptidoglycan-associated protein
VVDFGAIRIPPDRAFSPPLPSTRWITGLPRGANSADSLPLAATIELRLIADWIVQCNQAGAYPVVKVTAVGHAELREPAPQAVSLKRADAVVDALKNQIFHSFREEQKKLGADDRDFSSPLAIIQFEIRSFGSIANKRKVELIFERGNYVEPPRTSVFILDLIRDGLRDSRIPQPVVPAPKWWKLPTVHHRSEWHEIVNHLRNETPLKYFDVKTIVEGMWKAAQGDPSLDPNAGDETRQQAAEKWADELAEEWMKFTRDLQQRTTNPPGDPEEPPEPVIFNGPSFTRGPDQTVAEDAGPQTVVNWATDIAAVPPVTFKVTGNTNPRLFSTAPAVHAAAGADTGTLTYTPATHARGTATITLVMHDHGSNAPPNSNVSVPHSFTITVR